MSSNKHTNRDKVTLFLYVISLISASIIMDFYRNSDVPRFINALLFAILALTLYYISVFIYSLIKRRINRIKQKQE